MFMVAISQIRLNILVMFFPLILINKLGKSFTKEIIAIKILKVEATFQWLNTKVIYLSSEELMGLKH